ncbi:MAG: 4-alpha-glucanotransferase [Burkholderiales bacterium]|nr:4-alpha-glucanotransferase [Burkholderiales bacterium]
MRKVGALLAVASLPSKYGIGDFGNTAYEFIDVLAKMGMKVWQVLPLNPLGFGNSPYQPYSSFAGDEIYISLDKLAELNLLNVSDLETFNEFSSKIDYVSVRNHKIKILAKAFKNYLKNENLLNEVAKFSKNISWAYNYAVFLTLKKVNNLRPWNEWEDAHKQWINDRKFDLEPYGEQIQYELFIQYIFLKQWSELKLYANSHNIEIVGDIPIYLGFDSLDVWENQELFLLDDKQNPTFIAGVPPDYFSATGQRWGNPLYDWDKLEKTGFQFWIDRLRGNMNMYDVIRIDHFRAFDTYWKIPASCETAIDGEWVEAPGYKLFDAIYKKLPEIKIISEDLGDLRPEVLELRDHYNLPGMNVFQFNYKVNSDNSLMSKAENTVVYTGTHDNDTLIGWYLGLSKYKRKQIKNEFKASEQNITNKIIIEVLKYKANYIIFPVQDILGLDNSARINYPGKIGSPNWERKLSNFDALNNKVKYVNKVINL